MKLHHFREVVAIAAHGSIRAAARALEVSQPALTRSVAELERELGASLFERRARGVVATPLGQAFVRRANSIMQEVRRASDEVEQLRGTSSGTVIAGLSIAAHLALLPKALRPFICRFPNVKLHIIEGVYPTLEHGLREGNVDFYVGVDPDQKVAPELSRQLLCTNRRAILCRTRHPMAKATSLAQLAASNWITTSISVDDEQEVRMIFEHYHLSRPKISLRSQSALTLMTCLLNSDLLAMVPVQWSDFAVTREALTIIQVEQELVAPPLVVIKRSDALLTPAASFLLDLLQGACDLSRKEVTLDVA